MEDENKRIFVHYDEYKLAKDSMYYKIRDTIDNCIVNDEFEYNHMSYQGLTFRQLFTIGDELIDELNKFTENKLNEWCIKISSNIMNSIQGIFKGLVNINKINNFTPTELADLVYTSIVYQLDDGSHSPCLLEEVSIIESFSDDTD